MILKEIFRVKLVRIHAIFREKKHLFKEILQGRPTTFGSLSSECSSVFEFFRLIRKSSPQLRRIGANIKCNNPFYKKGGFSIEIC